MKKTLLKAFKELDDDTVIYLGTKQGTGWIEIDYKSELVESIEYIDSRLKDEKIKAIERANEILDDYLRQIVDTQNELKNEKDMIAKSNLRKKLAQLENTYAHAYFRKNEKRKSLNNFKPLLDRMVVEVYEHETDVKGISILVAGDENGHYWMKSEADKEHKRTTLQRCSDKRSDKVKMTLYS